MGLLQRLASDFGVLLSYAVEQCRPADCTLPLFSGRIFILESGLIWLLWRRQKIAEVGGGGRGVYVHIQ